MPALAGPVRRPLGHERGHHVVLLRVDLGECLEQGGLVGSGHGLIDSDGGLEDAGSRLFVQSLDGEVHVLGVLQQTFVEFRPDGVANHRVAKGAWCHGL